MTNFSLWFAKVDQPNPIAAPIEWDAEPYDGPAPTPAPKKDQRPTLSDAQVFNLWWKHYHPTPRMVKRARRYIGGASGVIDLAKKMNCSTATAFACAVELGREGEL